MVGRRIGWPLDYHRKGYSSQCGSDAAETAEIGAILHSIPRADGGGRIAADPAEDADPVGHPNGPRERRDAGGTAGSPGDRKSTRLNSSHSQISYAVFCLKKKKKKKK